MADWEELIKAGIVTVLGGIILGSVAIAGISQDLVDSLVTLGIFLIVLSFIVLILSFIRKLM